jgi:hypothetical protein
MPCGHVPLVGTEDGTSASAGVQLASFSVTMSDDLLGGFDDELNEQFERDAE